MKTFFIVGATMACFVGLTSLADGNYIASVGWLLVSFYQFRDVFTLWS